MSPRLAVAQSRAEPARSDGAPAAHERDPPPDGGDAATARPEPRRGSSPEVARGVAWSVGTLVAGKLIGFAAILVLARLLTPREFGIVGGVATFLLFIDIASNLGMQAVVVYEQERGISARLQTAFTLNLALTFVALAAGLALAGPAAAFFGVPGQAGLFRLAMLSLPIQAVGSIHDGVLLRDLSLARRSWPQVARGVAQAAVSVTLAFAGLGAEAMVLGAIAGYAAWSAAQWMLVPLRPRLRIDVAVAASMLRYGAGAWAFALTSWFSVQADLLMVGHVLGPRALGIYGLVYRLPELAVFNAAWTASLVAFPALARARVRGATEQVAEATLSAMHYLALYVLPVSAMLALFSGAIVSTLFSEHWQAAGPVLAGIATSVALMTVVFPIMDAAKAVGRQLTMVTVFALHLPAVVVVVSVASSHGLTAVAWSTAGASLALALAMLAWARWALAIRWRRVAAAFRAPFAATAGVCAAGTAVRLALDGAVAAPVELAVGLAAAAAAGVLALRLLAPASIPDLLGLARAARK